MNKSPILLGISLALVSIATYANDEPRTADGKPDLSGTYNVATLTPFQRPTAFGDNLYLTKEQGEKMAADEAERMAAAGRQSNPDRDAPPEGGDGSPGAAGNVGGYNAFWIDRGNDGFTVDGKFRTSILIDPPDGRMPPMTEDALEKSQAQRGRRQPNSGTAWWLAVAGDGPYDGPERLGLSERCITGFTGATPTFPSLYNNFKRIVQSEHSVMIMLEMVHDARVVRMNAEHIPAHITRWMGDSIGWWDGDTLVVDTTNFHPLSRQGRGGSEDMHVIERFKRMDDGNLSYTFTVEDASVWTKPWTGEYVWSSTDDKVYEYACHEGNYSMGGILRGARILESEWTGEIAGSGEE